MRRLSAGRGQGLDLKLTRLTLSFSRDSKLLCLGTEFGACRPVIVASSVTSAIRSIFRAEGGSGPQPCRGTTHVGRAACAASRCAADRTTPLHEGVEGECGCADCERRFSLEGSRRLIGSIGTNVRPEIMKSVA